MIVVFGSINLDLVARVERLPRPGETLAGISFALLPGGKGANQALAARRAGAVVAMAGAVGNDAFADYALSGLVTAGVDTGWISKAQEPTGVALIHVDRNGQNSITVIAGANARALPATIPDAALGPGTLLVMQLETSIEAVCALAARARSRGSRVMLNAAPAGALPEHLVASIDALIVNKNEAAVLADAVGMPAAPRLFVSSMHRRYGCTAIVTLGALGAVAAADGTFFHARAPTVQVVDSTGAGDAFVGAVAAARDGGAAWGRAICEGVAAGAAACTCAGAQSALPASATMEKLRIRVESNLASSRLD